MSRLISGKAAVSVLVAIFVMVCLTSSALAQVPADAVLAMHFDEGSGTIVKDESGYGNDGTIHGATWTSGISGKALSFDGADDYVEIPHKNSLDISNEITIGVWIRIASATSGIILEKDVIGTGLNDWTLGIGEGKPYFIVGVNYKNYNLKSPISVDDNNWHYIAVRRDFNGLLQLDVDGVEVASENFPKGSISNSESVHIGCWDTPRGIESFFEGTVDELYIYNQALSDEEIEALYKGLITPTPTPILPTPPFPKQSPLISVEKVASSSDVAYLELIYNPRLQNYYGYEVHLSNPNLEVSVPVDYSISYIAPIKVKGQDIGGKLIIWAGISAIDVTLGVPVASFAKTLYDIFNKEGSTTNVKKVELNNFLSDEIIPCSYTESFISGNKDIFVVQIISKIPTKNWKIYYQTTVDYQYLSDPSYEGTRKEPQKLSGTFLQSGEITINKEGIDHEWSFTNGNELIPEIPTEERATSDVPVPETLILLQVNLLANI